MTVATTTQLRFGRAEKALREAPTYRALELAWASHCAAFPDTSDEYRALLEIYHDRAAQFAVEAGKVLLAG
jgi:hypothetical protein